MTNTVYKGHLSRKNLGQNFLNDQFVIDKIISVINPKKNQVMVEIGPGLAALSEPVSEQIDKLTVIEVDQNLAMRLKQHPFLGKKLNIYQQNAMTMNFEDLSKEIGHPLRVFGNLPYNISIPLIFHLFNYIDCISDMHFMLQKEVVNRLIAKPNSKAYGKLSIIAQYFCNITPVFEVPPSAFIPSPKIYSTVVRLVPYQRISFSIKKLHLLKRITAEAFNQRRKTIRNSLGKLFTVNILREVNIDLSMRAENISIEQYCKLTNYINNNTLPKER